MTLNFGAALGEEPEAQQQDVEALPPEIAGETPGNGQGAVQSSSGQEGALKPYNPYDIETAKKRFVSYRQEAEKIVTAANALQVKDAATNTRAVEIGTEAKRIFSVIDSRRKEVLADAKNFTDRVNAFCKVFTEPLKAVELLMKGKMKQYAAKVELVNRAAEKKAAEEKQKLQEALNKEAAEQGVEAPTVPDPVLPLTPTTVRTEGGGSSYTVMVWKCTIKDPADVPREYCEPSQTLLNQAVKMGARDISGCVIEEVPEIRFRR
ncbi:MAG TPA: hypothetical protein PLD71_10625 [Syntrophales bacterium]|nr:hypothetical protein [Syntrophales bacterium]